MSKYLVLLAWALSNLLSAAPAIDPELEKAISDAPPKTATSPSASATPSTLKLADFFSSEKNPGKGSLFYSQSATQTETISFGEETGHYLMGLVFSSDTLPESMRAEFKNKEVIQLAFGTAPKTAGTRVPQFGAMTLTVSKGARTLRSIPLRIPAVAEAPLPESGFLLFTSPQMQAQISDEEKLRGSFFAKGGAVTLSASTTAKPIPVVVEGRRVSFKIQAMRLDLQADLGTPFNSEEHHVRGKVEFPLYYPDGAAAKNILRQLAEASFNAKTAIRIPEELNTRRQITSKPR